MIAKSEKPHIKSAITTSKTLKKALRPRSFPQYDEHFNPELVMTYNGSTWVSEFSSFFDSSKLKASGRIRAIYESTNKLSDTFYYRYQNPGSSEIYDIYHPGEAKTYTFRVGMFMPSGNGRGTWTYGTATFENKTINTSDNKITCIKIDKSKFSCFLYFLSVNSWT